MTLTIDLYADILCPWCIIEEYRLDKVLSERFPALRAEIRHHPVMLMPDCPPEGVRIADMLKARYGNTDTARAWERPHAEARASGLDLDLTRQPFAYPSLAAHTLVRLAGPQGTQHALGKAIITAYFIAARNIGDADVLAEIASEHGFDRDEARRLALDSAELALTQQVADAARAQGVTCVPHLAFGDGLVLNGCRSEDEIAAAMQANVARDQL